jgi:hypothetical protein
LGLRTDPINNNSQSSELSVDPWFRPLLQAKNSIEQLAQKIALAEAAVSVLGERGMIGDVAVEPQPTEPAIGQMKMDLLAQPSLRANAEAVADDERSDYQLGIDRGPPDVAIVRPQVRTNLGQVDEPTGLAGPRDASRRFQPAASRKQRSLPKSAPNESNRPEAPSSTGLGAPSAEVNLQKETGGSRRVLRASLTSGGGSPWARRARSLRS